MTEANGTSRVQQELNELRQRHLATHQRDKLKDLDCPLTTPEEAAAFLASMRDKTKSGIVPKPPSNLSADGMDAWFLQQRQREKEMRQRKKEAEELLRGYRMTMSQHKTFTHKEERGEISPVRGQLFGSPMNAISEVLDDPDSDTHEKRTVGRLDVDKSFLEGKRDEALSENIKMMQLNGHTPIRDDGISPKPGSSRRKSHMGALPKQAMAMEPDETAWRDFVSSDPENQFQPESGRYHLYASYACPGSHRALIVRSLKGLEDCIAVSIVHPTWRLTTKETDKKEQRGWVFSDPDGEPFANTAGKGGPLLPDFPGCDPDPLFGAYSVRDIYDEAGDTAGKYTVPILWDKKLNTIVNNESSDIAYMFNSRFNDFAANPELDLYTEDDPEKLHQVIEWLSPMMIHGVYRCGFAKTQDAYDEAIAELTEAFDKADELLQSQRFLIGNTLTDADIRLFVSLFRFDEVFAFYFRANSRMVMLTPSLLNYCREIYQMPGVAECCRMDHIKAHFFTSHAEWNKYSIIPQGLGFMKLLEEPHNRDEM